MPVSLLQIFPNADLRLLKQCVSLRDELLQMQYEQHKVGSYMTTILFCPVWNPSPSSLDSSESELRILSIYLTPSFCLTPVFLLVFVRLGRTFENGVKLAKSWYHFLSSEIATHIPSMIALTSV